MSDVDDTEARKALDIAYALAERQWHRDGYRCDVAEYQDAALTALTGCLERYRNTGKSFRPTVCPSHDSSSVLLYQ